MEEFKPKDGPVMITMFSVDGDHLIATHYCSAKNQPQMATEPITDAKANRLAFSLVRVTGLTTPDDRCTTPDWRWCWKTQSILRRSGSIGTKAKLEQGPSTTHANAKAPRIPCVELSSRVVCKLDLCGAKHSSTGTLLQKDNGFYLLTLPGTIQIHRGFGVEGTGFDFPNLDQLAHHR